MRALIAAGGTGGHIYPAIAVANELRHRDPAAVIRFVGTDHGLETRLVPQAGYDLSFIESTGLVNMGWRARARGVAVLPKSFFGARRLLREFRPDVVIGAGGYVTGPVLLTAALSRIPTLIMESNAIPGFTNRRLIRFVDAAAASFEATLPYFGSKGVVTGNPVRLEFFSIAARPRHSQQFSVLLFGGSQGARAINEAMIAALPRLAIHRERLRITHQTGTRDFGRVSEAYQAGGWSGAAEAREYIDDMVTAFANADLIVARAGATTSAELAAAGRASILVPLPGQLEQQRNAEVLQAAGAARMILQPDLSGEQLTLAIESLLQQPEKVTLMAQSARLLARPDAAAATVDIVERLIAGRRQVGAGS